MADSKNDLLSGSIAKQIMYFFFPILIGTFFQQLYNTVDAIVVGNYVGKEALGAVGGSTGTLIGLLISFINGLASGSTVVIAQAYGARDFSLVKSGVRSGMFLGISLGLIFMGIGLVFAPNMLAMMNVPADILPLSLIYMRIYLLGLVPVMVYNIGASILRAVGDSKTPLFFLIVSCITNVVLDLTLVAYFKLGVYGVAIATFMSQVIACVLVIFVLSKNGVPYQYLFFKDFGFDGEVLKRIVTIGFPMGIQSVMYSVSNLFIQANVNIYGTDTVAAYTAFGKIDAFYWMISDAFGVATVTIVGQCFGAGLLDRAKKACWTAVLMQACATLFVSTFCYFGGVYLFNLFTDDVAVIAIGMQILRFLAPTWITFTLVGILSATIRACGESLKPMLLTASGICGLRILWLIVYPAKNVIDKLWCYPISWMVTSILFLLYYFKGKWLQDCLNKKAKRES